LAYSCFVPSFFVLWSINPISRLMSIYFMQ